MKVLCPLDGSERSIQAMRRGVAMLAGCAPKVTLLGVQHAGFENAPEDIVEGFEEDQEDEIFPTRESCQEMLEAAAKGLPVKPRLVVVEGNVVKEIIAAAEDHDILLMHALNKSGLLEGLKMSNTEKLARKVSCSVLLVADDAA